MPIRVSRRIAGMAWRRALTLALCLVVLAAIMRPQGAEAHASVISGAGTLGISVLTASPFAGMPDDPHGEPAQHSAHCGCGIHAADIATASRLIGFRPTLRFTAGPQSGPEPSLFPNPKPPRA